MKTIQKISYTLVLVCSMLIFETALFSCSRGAASNAKTVACLMRNDTDAFLQSYIQSLQDAAPGLGAKLQIVSCNDDPAVQIDQLKTMLMNGIKYFVVVAVNTDMTEQMAKIIYSQGGAAAFSNIAPSVSALRVGKNFFYASSPESAAGEYQAQILDSYFKNYPDKAPGKVLNMLYLNGEYGHPAQIYRRLGLMEALSRLGYTVNVLGEDSANWLDTSSRQIMNNWLLQFDGRFNVVVAQNDAMALGAIESLLEENYTDDPSNPSVDTDGDGTVLRVPVLGVDATDAGKSSMAEQKLFATVLQDASSQAKTALELVWQCAQNGSADGFTTSGGITGAKEVTQESPVTERGILSQCYVVPFVPITR